MKKLILFFILLLSFTAVSQDAQKYFDGNGEVITRPQGLTIITEQLYQDDAKNIYFSAPYITYMSGNDIDSAIPTTLGIMLQKDFYDWENDSFTPLAKIIDINSYQVINQRIFKDKNYVYFYHGSENSNYPLSISKQLSADDIHVLNGNYLLNKGKVYYITHFITEMKDADATTFMTVKVENETDDVRFYYGKDKYNYYINGEVVDQKEIEAVINK